SRGRICESAVEPKSNPAGLLSKLDADNLLWRQGGDIKNMELAVGCIAEPYFPFIGSQANAMAWATVALGCPALGPLDFDASQHSTGRKITDLKAEQIVHIHKAQRVRRIDREGSNRRTKGAYRSDHGLIGGIQHGKGRRLQASKKDERAVEAAHRVVSAAFRLDPSDDSARCAVNHVPMRSLQGWDIQARAIRCD